MRIAVLGTGMVGQAIAGKLRELDHDVRVGSRTAGESKVTFADAAAHGEVVFNCTAGAASLDALAAAGEENLAGKLLIDVANPLDFSGGGPALFTDSTDSLGERIQRAFPSARVVKTLNTVTAAVMVDPASVPGDHVVFVCGDDAGAKDEARGLLGEFGWPAERVIDLGDITAARGTEAYLMLWLRLMGATGGPVFNIAVNRSAGTPT
jgi:8-hydroxy-5-deazaflavin:NADPH oxidoreductase